MMFPRVCFMAFVVCLASASLFGQTPMPPQEPADRVKIGAEMKVAELIKEAETRFPDTDWALQRRVGKPSEILGALGPDGGEEGKKAVESVTEVLALAATHQMQRNVCVVQAIRLKDNDSARKLLDIYHNVTKARFEEMAKKNERITVEISDEPSPLPGNYAVRRLVIKTSQFGQSSFQHINRFVQGEYLVEVTTMLRKQEDAVDVKILEAVFAAAKAL